MAEVKRRTPKFKRTDFSKYSKLGVRRKKKQVYRRPKGIDNKINKKMKGHLRRVMIGFKNAVDGRGLIDGMEPVMVFNVSDLLKVGNGEIAIVGKVGMKKRIEIASLALEKNVRLYNLNVKKFLNSVKEVEREREEKKGKRVEKVKEKEKVVKEKEKKDKEEAENEEAPAGVPSEGKEKDKDKESIEDKIKDEGEKKEIKKIEDKEIKKDESKAKAEKKEVQTNNYGRGK